MLALLLCQLSGRQSLRYLVDGFNSKRAHHYHLGTGVIRHSSLADANRDRPVAVFQETFFYLLEKVRSNLPSKGTAEMVHLIDSTTIDLNLNQFQWTEFRSTKAGIKLHTVYDSAAEVPIYFEMTVAKVNDRKAFAKLSVMPGITYVVGRVNNDYVWHYASHQRGSTFVGRMKSNAVYEVIDCRDVVDETLVDEVIHFTAKKAKKGCPIALRRITFRRAEDLKVLVFIHNYLTSSAADIAALYKQR
ncbi:MAG: putative transposase [Gammaproteobacteria bacterium]|jgi:putative transposase